MFDSSGLPDLTSVLWSRLKPGMIFLDGVHINGSLPEELRDFAILNPSKIDHLHAKYRLNNDRPVKVLVPGINSLSPQECIDTLKETESRLKVLNGYRQSVNSSYRKLGVMPSTALQSKLVRNDSLIYPWGQSPQSPTMLNRIDHSISLADALTKSVLAGYNFPTDKPCRIHLVADLSFSMKATGRDSYVTSALSLFYNYLVTLLPLASFHLYGFSDECLELTYPISGDELPRKETSYDSFLRKVLHNSSRDMSDLVILLTDGLPNDFEAALRRLNSFPSLGIDYIQCIFNIKGDKREVSESSVITLDGYITDSEADTRRLSESEYEALLNDIKRDYSILTNAAKGMQVILQVDHALSVVSIEAFDRWLGK